MNRIFWISLIGIVSFLSSPARANDPDPAPVDDPAFLGVKLAPVPEALAAHLKGSGGTIIEEVVPGSPAEKAGLKRHDLVVSVNGNALKSPDELRALVVKSKPGEAVKLGVVRGSEKLDIEATLGSMPSEDLAEVLPVKPGKEAVHRGFLGVGPAEVPPVLAAHLGLKDGAGVVIGDVLKESPAEKAGLEINDIITSIDGHAIGGAQDFLKTMGARKAGDEVKLEIYHKGEKKSVKAVLVPRPMDLPEADEALPVLPRWGMKGGSGAAGRWGRPFHQGKIMLQGPDGSVLEFEIPDAIWKTDEIFKEFENKLGEFKDLRIPQMKAQLRKALKEFGDKLQDEPAHESITRAESHSAVVRTVEGGYDITVKDQNGLRTVTVLKEGKAIAADLPWDKIDTLPEDVRGKVRSLGDSIKVQADLQPEPAAPALPLPGGKVKA